MRFVFLTLMLIFVWLKQPAQAEPVVVELFTSQGCSSCPPADALLAELGQSPDIIGLAYHVDYWDYIGWKDTFSDPVFTNRQRDYARFAGHRSVFTPHFVIDGQVHIAGVRTMEIMKHIQLRQQHSKNVHLSIDNSAEEAVLIAQRDQSVPDHIELILVGFLPAQNVEILRGENAGKTLTYTHIVKSIDVLATWQKTEFLRLVLPETDTTLDYVVIAQMKGPSTVVGSLRLN